MDQRETVSVADLRRLSADVLNRAVQGEVTIVTSRGRPIAAVVPLAVLKAADDATSD